MITCEKNYMIMTSSQNYTSVELACQHGSWVYPQHVTCNRAIICKPVCEKPCLNGGVCIHPCQCQCPFQYSGDQCEIMIGNCPNILPGFQNGDLKPLLVFL